MLGWLQLLASMHDIPIQDLAQLVDKIMEVVVLPSVSKCLDIAV